ncbi:hypothetical protein BGX28_005400 [Mortierella sp. GBA30]|nr:hypothetical protein BGX28_005400 [Mortierella sp. GBA30]
MEHDYPPTSSGDNSDLEEDQYGEFDTDELLPSSDSDLVSHPSDNEDARSPSISPSPAHSATRQQRAFVDDDDDGDVDEDDDSHLPSFSLSSQDLDQRQPSHHEEQLQDDFLPVERSDLESSSRPHSPLSQHSDVDDGWVPMRLVYPSMTLSPACATSLVHQYKSAQKEMSCGVTVACQEEPHFTVEEDELAVVDNDTLSVKQGEVKDAIDTRMNMAQLHTSLLECSSVLETPNLNVKDDTLNDNRFDNQHGAHKIIPDDALCNVQESNRNDVQEHMQDSIHEDIRNDAKSDVQKDRRFDFQHELRYDTHQGVREYIKDHKPEDGDDIQQLLQIGAATSDQFAEAKPAVATSDSTRSVWISISWRRLTAAFGFLLVSVLASFLAVEYSHFSSRPAHVSVTEVDYLDDYRAAMVKLHVFTTKLQQLDSPSRAPGFHMRVLPDNKSWNLGDAPAQPLHLFSEPIVSCVRGGWCTVYISSLHHQGGRNRSPRGCLDDTYYLHIWFANGTRISDSPPVIFSHLTTKNLGSCSSRTGRVPHEDEGPDPLGRAYNAWHQWRQSNHDVFDRTYLSMNWMNMPWDRLHAALSEVHHMVDIALTCTQRSLRRLSALASQSAERLFTEDSLLERALAGLERARRNARVIKNASTSKFQEMLDRASQAGSQDRGQLRTLSKEQIQALKTAIKARMDELHLDSALQKADHILLDAETKLEAILQSDTIRKLTRKIPADQIKRAADRLVLEVDGTMGFMRRSELVREVSSKLQRKLDRFRSTRTGSKVIHEAKAIKTDVKQLWKDLQDHMRRI